ncbi:MAG: ABC transporter ATP-binding protein [bacterium]
MIKLIKYLKPYWWQLLLVFILVYIQVETDLKLPDYMAKIINEGIVAENNHLIFSTGLIMLGVALIGAVGTIGVGYFAAKVSTGLARDLRHKVFTKVESFSMQEFDKFSTASLITRSTNDIQQIQMVIFMILRIVVSAPMMGIGAIWKAYRVAPNMSWIIGLGVAILFSLIIFLFAIAINKFKLLQQVVDKLNQVTRENLTGLRVIRAFNREKFEEKKFNQTNRELTQLNLFVNRLMILMQPMVMLIFNLTSVAIVWFGAKLINTDNLSIGNMMAFMQYAMQVIFAFLMLSMVFIMIPRAAVSGDRIAEVLDTKIKIKNPKSAKKFTATQKGVVEFKDVFFSYPNSDEPVLKAITFTALPGQTTAFIGSTGSGKSTLINLIPRFFDVSAGQILIDETDIREVTLKALHDKIGYIPQKGILFSGTIADNIKYGAPDASEKAMTEAAAIAQAETFINKLEDKFNSNIAQGGANVSGGQKQRLAIARAIIKKPEIYIFDDSFSALDFKTDAALRKALAKSIKNTTVLIVTQRISTILNADKILVLDEGKIVGEGTHLELMSNCKVYQEIAASQLSSEELAKEAKRLTNSQRKGDPS